MRRFQLTLAYDGSRYLGWQRLANSDRTIQGKLETALSRLLNEPIEVCGSGRTDAGVHAMGQVASFDSRTTLSCEELLTQLRQVLPEDIGALSLREADPRFHARLSATGKTYRYRVWNSEAPCVFARKYVYVLPQPLELDAMQAAAGLLTGTHDFRSFCAKKNDKKSTVRTVEQIEIVRQGEELWFTYSGDGFLYQMVRIMTGTLLEVGMGKRRPESMVSLLSAENRALAGYTVPAKGLCLMEVRYK